MVVDKRNKCLGSVYVYYLIKQNTPKNELLTTCKTVCIQTIDKIAYGVILAISSLSAQITMYSSTLYRLR